MLSVPAGFIQDHPVLTAWGIVLLCITFIIYSNNQNRKIARLENLLDAAEEDLQNQISNPYYRPPITQSISETKASNRSTGWSWLLVIPLIYIGAQYLPLLPLAMGSGAPTGTNALLGKYRGVGVGPLNSNNYSLTINDTQTPAQLILTNENSGESYGFTGESRMDGNTLYLKGKMENESTILGIPFEGQLTNQQFLGTITTLTGQYRMDLRR